MEALDDAELNEIFRVFGHAAFYAWLFESELAALAGTLHSMTHPYLSKAAIRQYDAMLRRHRTAGKLVKEELTALTKQVPAWGRFLMDMSEVRNHLMHAFYEEQLPQSPFSRWSKARPERTQDCSHEAEKRGRNR